MPGTKPRSGFVQSVRTYGETSTHSGGSGVDGRPADSAYRGERGVSVT